MTWILKHWTLRSRHEIALILAIPMLTGAATYVAVKLAAPQPVVETAMGDRWQCSKTAFIITTCTKKPGEAIARATHASAGYVAAR